MAPAQLLAFSTSSSAATLPVTMERVTDHLGVDNEVSSFVLPVGATIKADGTSLYRGRWQRLHRQALHFPLEFTDQLTIILTALLASIGSAAVPGAGMVMLVIVLEPIGFPADKLAIGPRIIPAIDRPLDMLRTVVNVTGDSMVSVVADGQAWARNMRREGSLLLILLVVAMNALSQEHTYQKTDSTIRLNEVIANAYSPTRGTISSPAASPLTTEEMERGDGNSFAQALHAMPGIYMHSGTYATSRIVIRAWAAAHPTTPTASKPT